MPSIWDLIKANSTLETGSFWDHLNSQSSSDVTLNVDFSLDVNIDGMVLEVEMESLSITVSDISDDLAFELDDDQVTLALDNNGISI